MPAVRARTPRQATPPIAFSENPPIMGMDPADRWTRSPARTPVKQYRSKRKMDRRLRSALPALPALESAGSSSPSESIPVSPSTLCPAVPRSRQPSYYASSSSACQRSRHNCRQGSNDASTAPDVRLQEVRVYSHYYLLPLTSTRLAGH